MSESYFTLKEKISSLIGQQAPDFVKSDHSGFTDFLQTYYVFLEAAELQLTDISEQDEILLESDNVASLQKLIYYNIGSIWFAFVFDNYLIKLPTFHLSFFIYLKPYNP